MKKIKMLKRLTLKQARDYCRRQWRWIIKQMRAGDTRNANELKAAWLIEHVEGEVRSHCFYCDYTTQYHPDGDTRCDLCPGTKIDPNFSCHNHPANYFSNPEAFYKELLRLERMEAKKCPKKN